jgi:predicted RNase H-like nuclease (RuvC/YqgF family)
LKIDDLANNNLLRIGKDGSPDRVDLTGTLFINNIDNSNPDYVFEPEYKLESIEEHASYMWKNKHLPAVGAGVNGENGKAVINVANRSQGILEELEKAHLYIEQLHKRINNEKESSLEVNNKQQQTIDQQAEEIADLKAQFTKMETQLAELIQLVSALNKTNDSSDSSDKAVGEKE